MKGRNLPYPLLGGHSLKWQRILENAEILYRFPNLLAAVAFAGFQMLTRWPFSYPNDTFLTKTRGIKFLLSQKFEVAFL